MDQDEEMFKKRICLDILIILFLSHTALSAADLVVPAIKAPYAINDAQFDNTGDYFAYEVNGKVYIRDSLSLFLKDTYASNSTKVSPFYGYPDRIDYPKVKITLDGNAVTVKSQKSAGSQTTSVTLNNLPGKVTAAAVNKSQNYLGFTTEDGKAYVYDLQSGAQKLAFTANSDSKGITFTKDNKLIVSDTGKTAGLYDLSGQKIKTYTTAASIKSVNLSSDEETLIISDSNGTLNFYNTSTTTQIGYIPNFGSKNIVDAVLSKDSKRILITGENNTLYIAPIQDVLFSQNTVAPTAKQFAINYNAYDPNDRSSTGITEFGTKEYVTKIDNADAEYITSTQEKGIGTQNFKLDEERKAGETVIITQQPEQAYFPPSEIIKDREADFTDKTDRVIENEVLVQEFKQPKDYTTEKLYVDNGKNLDKATVTEYDNKVATKEPVTTDRAVTADRTGTASGSGTDKAEINRINSDGTTQTEALTDRNITINIFGDTGKKAEEPAKVEEEPKVEEKKEEVKEEKKKEEKEEKKKEVKEKKKLTEEDYKTLFKDGHGLYFNVSLYKLQAPYDFEVSFQTGYRNYNLIRPFYFGGTVEPFIATPSKEFPYKYRSSSGLLRNPYLLGAKVYAPIGFCIYPLKNSLEIYAEIGVGASFNTIWNGEVVPNCIFSGIYPGFYGNTQIGAAWDFFNLSISGSFDAVTGWAYGLTFGVIVNIGGSRVIGSTKFK